MTLNPYESPETTSPEIEDDSVVWVDGKHLAIRSGVALPQLCVKTNQPVSDEEYAQRKLTWCSPLTLLLIPIGLLIFLIAYYLIRKKCVIAYGLARNVRRKYLLILYAKIGLAILLFVAIPFADALSTLPVILTVCILFLISVVAIFFGNSPISIAKYSDGVSWIKGCSQEFLADLEL